MPADGDGEVDHPIVVMATVNRVLREALPCYFRTGVDARHLERIPAEHFG